MAMQLGFLGCNLNSEANVCYEKFVTHLLLYTVANVSRIFRNRRYKTSYETLNGKKYLAFDRQIDRT